MTDSFHRSLDRALLEGRRLAFDKDYSWGLDGARIRAMQDALNADIARLAAITGVRHEYIAGDDEDAVLHATHAANQYAIRRDPAYDDSWLDVGHAFLDALDIEHDSTVVVAWGNPEPVRVEFSLQDVHPDILALLFGGVVGVPLCLQQIPAEGQE